MALKPFNFSNLTEGKNWHWLLLAGIIVVGFALYKVAA